MDGNVLKKEGSFAGDEGLKISSAADRQKLLSVLRGTRMTRDEYNELRDLVRELAESGDGAKESELIAKLAAVGIAAVADNAPATVEKVQIEPVANTQASPEVAIESKGSRFGLSRPRPSFASVQTEVVSSGQKTPDAAPEPEPPVAEKEESRPEQEPETASTPEVVPEPAPTEPATPEIENVAPAVSYENPAERIKEIKKEVNSLVGNPVNLIEKHNEVGRAYMNALLSAMKKVNGGNTAEVNAAMSHLEETYKAVKQALDGQPVDLSKLKDKVAPIEKPTPEPTLEEQPESEIPQPEVVPTEPQVVEEPTPVQTHSKGEVVDDSHPESSDSIVSPFRPMASAPAVDVPQAESVISEEPDAQVPVVPEVGLPKSDLYGTVETAEEPVVSAPEPAPAPASAVVKPLQSVATEKTQSNIDLASHREEAVAAEEVKAAEIAAMDPYERPEVTKGLEQLLSEWSLFKSSGIFGTGPHGLEHPLYKKLAGLQMSALVSGRFEDAKPEIRQSIADYMNGWRYEVGILYQHGETFEHYLRRVIRKILDKQQSKIEEAA